MTSVISVRGRDRDELLRDKSFVYVGRAMPYQGWKASAWGNPFKPGMTAEAALRVFTAIPEADRLGHPESEMDFTWTLLDCHAAYVKARRSLWQRLPELRGSRLGCWCCRSEWTPATRSKLVCHGQTLAVLAEGLDLADYRDPEHERLF